MLTNLPLNIVEPCSSTIFQTILNRLRQKQPFERHYVPYSSNCYLTLGNTYFTNPVQLLSPLCLVMCACLVLYYVNQDLHEKLQLLQMQYFLW